MSEIRPTREEKAIFTNQYQRGAKIFEDSLDSYHEIPKSPNTVDYKKKTLFGQAMDDALKAMHDASSQAFNKKMQAKEKQLEEDYKTFINTQSDEDYQKVKVDLQNIKEGLS